MKSYDVEWYHHLPPHVKEILDRLGSAGRKAFVVGGAVRDLWLGKEPKDFDLVSEAMPEEIEKLFPKTLDVGRSFGIMIVVTEAGPVEVARFRADGAYTDSRHPDEIKFSNPDEDAQRRDFTINGLFYDPATGKVIDYVGGVEDLQAKRIRAVGDPTKRFEEDALRMLRAIRFQAQLGDFELDSALMRAIQQQSSRLSLVSKERITQEMKRIWESAQPSVGLLGLAESGLWQPVFHCASPAKEILCRFDEVKVSYELRFDHADSSLFLAAGAHWIPGLEPENRFILEREVKAKVAAIRPLLKQLAELPRLSVAKKKELASGLGFGEAWAIFTLTEKNPGPWLEFLEWRAEKEKAGKLQPAPLFKGADLLALGIKPGPEVKKLLEQIRVAQWNEEISTRAEAEQLLRKLRNL
jgi:tRNA nucleotidyltransferase/poly(A) polymerase